MHLCVKVSDVFLFQGGNTLEIKQNHPTYTVQIFTFKKNAKSYPEFPAEICIKTYILLSHLSFANISCNFSNLPQDFVQSGISMVVVKFQFVWVSFLMLITLIMEE